MEGAHKAGVSDMAHKASQAAAEGVLAPSRKLEVAAMLIGLFCIVLTLVLYRLVRKGKNKPKKRLSVAIPASDRTQYKEDDGRPVRGSKIEEREKLIHDCGLFDGKCKDSEIRALAAHAQMRVYNPNDVMIVQGKIGDCMYIIKEGHALVTINRSDKDMSPHDCPQVDRKMPGVHFGEVALMCDTERTAHVIAEDKVECLVISRADFLEAMPHDALSH